MTEPASRRFRPPTVTAVETLVRTYGYDLAVERTQDDVALLASTRQHARLRAAQERLECLRAYEPTLRAAEADRIEADRIEAEQSAAAFARTEPTRFQREVERVERRTKARHQTEVRMIPTDVLLAEVERRGFLATKVTRDMVATLLTDEADLLPERRVQSDDDLAALTRAFHQRTGRCIGASMQHEPCVAVEAKHRAHDHSDCIPSDGEEPPESEHVEPPLTQSLFDPEHVEPEPPSLTRWSPAEPESVAGETTSVRWERDGSPRVTEEQAVRAEAEAWFRAQHPETSSTLPEPEPPTLEQRVEWLERAMHSLTQSYSDLVSRQAHGYGSNGR